MEHIARAVIGIGRLIVSTVLALAGILLAIYAFGAYSNWREAQSTLGQLSGLNPSRYVPPMVLGGLAAIACFVASIAVWVHARAEPGGEDG